MNDAPRVKLRELITEHGASLCDDPRRCEALLKDFCWQHKREIHVLVAALKNGVARELLALGTGMLQEVQVNRLSQRLEAELALTAEAAQWGVETWLWALGLGIPQPETVKVSTPANGAIVNAPEPTPPVASDPTLSREVPQPVDIHGWLAQQAQERQRQVGDALGLIQPTAAFWHILDEGGQGPKLMLIPPGSYQMGGLKYGDGKPVHKVTIAYPFALGKYPVTKGEFAAFVRSSDYVTEAEAGNGAYVWAGWRWKQDKRYNWRNPGFSQGEDHPVVCMSWNDAHAYCQWLREQTGHKYRLPSEAEWEYAARAGETGELWPGELDRYAWYWDNAGQQTHPVGEKDANPLGLHDVFGTVWEWCEDGWEENYNDAPCDGSYVIRQNNYNVLRGGSCISSAEDCRFAYRSSSSTDSCYLHSGFRVCCLLA